VKNIFLVFLSLFLLAGCVQERIIDEINIEVGSAFDAIDEENFIGAFLIQDYLPDKSIKNRVYQSTASLRRDLMMKIQKQSSQEIYNGGLLITIFGNKLADTGIIDFVDTYQREPSVGARNYLATSSGSAIDILRGEYGSQGTSAYIFNLIEHNIQRRDVPRTNLHIFLRDFYKKGKDAYLPELTKKGENELQISGISIFKEDREAYVIPMNKMFFFKLMVDKHSQGSFRVHLGKGRDADVESISSKYKLKLAGKSKDRANHVNVHIKIRGMIKEFTGKRLDQKEVNKIEKKLQKIVERECLKLLKTFQEKGVDPVGFGYLHRSKIRGFNVDNWEKDYPNLTFDVKCNVTIVETGVIE